MSLQSRHNKEQSKRNQFYLVKLWWCSYQSITDHYHHHDHHDLTISILYCLFPGMRTRWQIWRNWAVRAFFHHRDPMIGFMVINIMIMHYHDLMRMYVTQVGDCSGHTWFWKHPSGRGHHNNDFHVNNYHHRYLWSSWCHHDEDYPSSSM